MPVSIDVTDATFQTEVLDRSTTTPVVVDLWAPWCGPCRTLGPILEKVVDETDGKVVLAKVNVDENPQVSQAFQVQGIPAVFAVDERQGRRRLRRRPARGARPAVRRQPAAQRGRGRKLAALLAAGDEASLRQVLDERPDHHDAIVALAELLAGKPDDTGADEALALLERIPETPETRRVAALARTGGDADAADDGDDITAKLDDLLDRVKDDDEARQEFVDLLEVLGPDDPRTADYRKRLTRQLF